MSTLLRAYNNPETNQLYIWGAFDYDDGFPHTKRRRTEFVFSILVRAHSTNRLSSHFGLCTSVSTTERTGTRSVRRRATELD